MKRKYETFLNSWLINPNKKPLILRGARQVGKSTLVKLFCENNDLDLLEINFENISLSSLSNSRDFKLENLLRELELETSMKITDKTVIFFDEIQNSPIAIEKLRYFYESENNYNVIAAGSLLELVLDQEKISFPVGRVDFLNIGPMDFTEFLEALDDQKLLNFMDDFNLDFFPENLFNEYLDRFKEYLYVGGMPEAISVFRETKDFNAVRSAQKSILLTYRNDIPKYTNRSKQAEYISNVFDYTIGNVGRKVIFSEIASTNSAVVKESIRTLALANIIQPCFYSSASGLPLFSQMDKSVMKLYFLDVGLLNAAMGLDMKTLMKFKGDDLMTKGLMVEQFVSQHLSNLNYHNEDSQLFYWLNVKKGASAEVDFVVEHNGEIFPLEVKSGSMGKMKSLFQFIGIKKKDMGIKLDLTFRDEFKRRVDAKIRLGNENAKIECNVLSLPVFFISRFKDFL